MNRTSEIGTARALLEQAEREITPTLKLKHLKRGIALLQACEDEDVSDDEHSVIRNVRTSHTRRLLAQLVSLHSISMNVWADYVHLLLGSLRAEVSLVLAVDPELRRAYIEFINLWREELTKLMGHDALEEFIKL